MRVSKGAVGLATLGGSGSRTVRTTSLISAPSSRTGSAATTKADEPPSPLPDGRQLHKPGTFGAYTEEFLDSAVDLSPSTRATYETEYRLYLKPALGAVPIGNVRPQPSGRSSPISRPGASVPGPSSWRVRSPRVSWARPSKTD